MNNFEQKDEILEHLRQVAHNLTLIVEHTEQVTPIERDLLLQLLRESYVGVLQLEIGKEIPAVKSDLVVSEKKEEVIANDCESVENTNIPAAPAVVETPAEPAPAPETPAEMVAAPAEEEAPVAEEAPIAEEAPVAEEAPIAEEAPVENKVTPVAPVENVPAPAEEPEEEKNIAAVAAPAAASAVAAGAMLSAAHAAEAAPVEPAPVQTPVSTPAPAAAPVSEATMAGASALLNGSSDILDFLGSSVDTAWTNPEKTEVPQPEVPAAEPAKTEPVAPVFVAPQPAPAEETIVAPARPVAAPAAPVPESLFPQEQVPQQPAQKKSLHDILAQQHEDNSLAAKYQRSHIDDLSKAISINDKFSYIRELFNGKSEDFSRSIQKLNGCQSLDDAFSELEMMKKYYLWDTTSSAYLSLCDLVRRKFI